MASWIIFRDGRGKDTITLYYINHVTGMRYTCGKESSDVPDQMLVDWIFRFGNPAYGDQIKLSDGTSFFYRAPEGARA
jgi:hypothetical protein